MGLRHGTYCMGCCLALFAVLVANGIMRLAWMLLLMLGVFVEKLFPQRRRPHRRWPEARPAGDAAVDPARYPQ